MSAAPCSRIAGSAPSPMTSALAISLILAASDQALGVLNRFSGQEVFLSSPSETWISPCLLVQFADELDRVDPDADGIGVPRARLRDDGDRRIIRGDVRGLLKYKRCHFDCTAKPQVRAA